jgi:excisionase family DNA binding protein
VKVHGRVNGDEPKVGQDQDDQEYLERLGLRVRIWRTQKGLSQAALARRARMSRTYVRHVEGARYGARVHHLRSLARGLGVEVYQLVPPLSAETDGGEATDRPGVPFADIEAAYEARTPALVIRDVAEILSLSKSRVCALARAGRFPAWRDELGRWRIPLDDFTAFVASIQRPSTRESVDGLLARWRERNGFEAAGSSEPDGIQP